MSYGTWISYKDLFWPHHFSIFFVFPDESAKLFAYVNILATADALKKCKYSKYV